MIICYLAGPIDYEKDRGGSWKKELLDLCSSNKDIGFFDPRAPFKFNKVDRDIASYIHDVNKEALIKADILVGRLMEKQTSVGTPIEFYHAFNLKLPMVILTDMDKSIYMKHIGTRARFVKDIAEMYDSLTILAAEWMTYLNIKGRVDTMPIHAGLKTQHASSLNGLVGTVR